MDGNTLLTIAIVAWPVLIYLLFALIMFLTELLDLIFNSKKIDEMHRRYLLVIQNASISYERDKGKTNNVDASILKELEDHNIKKALTRMFR